MPEQLWVTALLNRYFAGVANAILNLLHVPSHHPQAPITNYVAMQLVAFVLLMLLFVAVRLRLSVENPGSLQHGMEMVDSFVTKARRGGGHRP